MTIEDLGPEPGWEELRLPLDIGSGRSMFVQTEAGPTIRMRFFRRAADDALVGRVWFGQATFGPPGFVHGGVVAFVLDEAMGAGAWLRRYPCVAASLNLDYLEMTPIGRTCSVEARVVDVRRNKVSIESELRLGEQILVRGRGVFVRLKRERWLSVARDARVELPDLSEYEFID